MNERDRKLAREAGIKMSHDETLALGYLDNAHKKFVELIRADEREACARVCEEQYEYYGHDHVFAKAIRARSNT